MHRSTTIELFKEEMKFSAGHFTIFSATSRERLHGHNFTVFCSIAGTVDENGLLGDYGAYKRVLFDLCRKWDEVFLLPGNSPHLRLQEAGQRVDALFGDEVIPFLTKDVLVLPVKNVTLEELAALMLSQLVEDSQMLERDKVEEIVVKVSSGPGQFASCVWRRGGEGVE